jgi:hypothetical protein
MEVAAFSGIAGFAQQSAAVEKRSQKLACGQGSRALAANENASQQHSGPNRARTLR